MAQESASCPWNMRLQYILLVVPFVSQEMDAVESQGLLQIQFVI
ncbi:hypothetical protein EYZ11_008203 [Aspergillus tanneri]|uniref:Uncharacterized protein n=1 Tax=Aspergillus tanneri TaxID=1220188 RepID=A0A4V3UNT3_9EURO|nr:hypothetical protein EYZ11_008203 [Aspergillus tanneri]